MEKKEPSYTVEKLKTEQPYDPAITFLGIYLDKTIIQDPFIPMFTTALFTIARTWKQPKCLSAEEWIKKMCCIHAVEYCLAIKGKEIMPFAETWMGLETIIQSEVNLKEKNKYHILLLICGIYNDEHICKAERGAEIENKFMDIMEGREVVGWIGRLRLTQIRYRQLRRTSCIAQGTLLNVLW